MNILADGLDYQLPQLGLLQFSGGNQQSCININLLSDVITEGDERFTIMLTTEEDRITLTRDTAVITIIDNNGEYDILSCVQWSESKLYDETMQL